MRRRDQLDEIIDALADAPDDHGARHDVLDRASLSLLKQPGLGGQLIARLCAADKDNPDLEYLGNLLRSALDAGRMARENGQKRGSSLLSAIEDGVELAARQGKLDGTRRFLLARAWIQSGLQAPRVLELTQKDAVEAASDISTSADRAEVDAMLDKLLQDIVRETEGDAQTIHATFMETFPTMPEPMREHVVEFVTSKPEPIYAELGCFWLLDPSPTIRRAAAAGLESRLGKGLLGPETIARIVGLRSWIQEDEARKRLDNILHGAMRLGIGSAAPKSAWTVLSALASLPDGAGAQSFGIALQSGKKRCVAMVLLKQGHGVKDAYVMPCPTASDQKSLLKHLVRETGALPVSLDYIASTVSMALGEGQALGISPAPGLVDVVTLCGMTELRPTRSDTEGLLEGLASHAKVIALPSQKRPQLVNASANWWDRHQIVENWFEDSDAVHDLMDRHQSSRAMESALWKWLETRRSWWAQVIARAAATLEASDHRDAESFTATAMALLNGLALDKIPVMNIIHHQTIVSWFQDDLDMDFDPEFEAGAPTDPLPPKPERKGEFAKLLKGSIISVEWIDGFLMAMVVSPKVTMPDLWLPLIMENASPELNGPDLLRLIDIIMMHANGAVELANDKTDYELWMGQLKEPAKKDWAAGFTAGCESFPKAWPKKSVSRQDRSVRRLISDAAATGFAETDLRMVALWLASRCEHVE